MGLPTPTYSFTIPSIQDDTELCCRIYHPRQRTTKHFKCAIVAHPYAPLGGCYDDPVVDLIGSVLSKAGYIVGTFNFRGAGESSGRTSWSAKPELSDYISFYAFIMFYIHGLQASNSSALHDMTKSSSLPAEADNNPIMTRDELPSTESKIRLVLAGYSYGSMICAHLPTFEIVMQALTSPKAGSAEAEIQLRATRLASQRSKELKSKRQSRGRRLRVKDVLHDEQSHSIAMGGDESDTGSRRVSRDARRSLDLEGLRKSLDVSRKRLASRRESSEEELEPTVEVVPTEDIQKPEICYLLVSPLLPPVALFTTMFTKISFSSKIKAGSAAAEESTALGANSELVLHKSLAIYGDSDFFTSQKKLRKWAEQVYRQPKSRFRFVEIDGAGHFWHEAGAAEKLRASLLDWIESLG